MTIPRLLIVSKLLRPLSRSKNLLDRIAEDLDSSPSETLTHGAFVMAISAVEVGLNDTLKYFLIHFPEKTRKESEDFQGHGIASGAGIPAAESAQAFVSSLSYKSFIKYFERFQGLLAIEIGEEQKVRLTHVREIKASRNLLLHNGPMVNETYLEQAGRRRRAKETGGALKFDLDYVSNSVSILLHFVDSLAESIDKKYGKYTKIEAHRELWNYMFPQPLAKHEEFWGLWEERDRINTMERPTYESMMSSTELIILGLWRAHFNGNGEYLKNFNMHRFDKKNAERVLFFISIAREFPWE